MNVVKRASQGAWAGHWRGILSPLVVLINFDLHCQRFMIRVDFVGR